MKNKPQRRLANDFLGKRILERYRRSRGTLRARIALVLRRSRGEAGPASPPRNFRPGISHYGFSLHVHLAHLGWLPARARRAGRPRVAVDTVLRTAAWTPPGQRPAVEAAPGGFTRPDVARGSTATRPATEHVARPRVPVASGTSHRRDDGAPSIARPDAPARGIPAGAAAAQMRTFRLREPGVHSRLMHLRVDATRERSPRETFAASLARRQAPLGSAPRAAAASPGDRTSGRAPAAVTSADVVRAVHHEPTGSHAIAAAAGPAAVRTIGRDQRVHVDRDAARASDLGSPLARHRRGSDAGEASRVPLYAQPVSRNFANPPAPASPPHPSVVNEPRAMTPPPPAPQIDLARLGDDVYRHIERKLRVERERRGL